MNSVDGITYPAVPDLYQKENLSQNAQSGFGNILSSTIQSTNSAQNAGDIAIEKLMAGEANHLHEVMIAVEEADISLRMLVQMRNKALSAYEEIMRMQI